MGYSLNSSKVGSIRDDIGDLCWGILGVLAMDHMMLNAVLFHFGWLMARRSRGCCMILCIKWPCIAAIPSYIANTKDTCRSRKDPKGIHRRRRAP